MAGRKGKGSNDQGGFTLVELLVALSLVGLILALVGSVFLWGYRHVGRTVDTFDMETDGYTVLREITAGYNDAGSGRQVGLIAAESVQFSSDTGAKTLKYTWDDGGQPVTISYVWVENAGTVTREIDDLGPLVLLDQVTSFHLCLDGSLLEVELSQQNSRTPVSRANTVTRMYPRNAEGSDITVPLCS